MSGAQRSSLNPGTYVLQMIPVAGYEAPANDAVTVSGGNLTTVTYTYVVELTALEAWRQEYFGISANSGDAADLADPDGDGFNNAAEYTVGTNPTISGDYLKAENATHTATTFSVTTGGKAGRTYTLERSSTLAPNSWSLITSQGPLTNDATITLTDMAAPNDAAFYRIRVTGP